MDMTSATYEVRDPRFRRSVKLDEPVERLWTGGRWTEGPVYSALWRSVIFSDIPNDRRLRYDELTGCGITSPVTPAPLNLFENAPNLPGRQVEIAAPLGRPGDRVELTLRLDAVVVVSACPQDMVPTNGADMIPRDVELLVA